MREALETARQMAVALEAAHRRGIVHRDLTPANVKVTPEGRLKLLDFGLGKALEGGASPATPPDGISDADSREGLVVGTAAYMSPEQARGLALDPRTDLWSFGCVLFELLTGRQAFSGSSISDVLAAILVREPDWNALPENTPTGARHLLQRCLQKDATRRPVDAGIVAAEIEEILSGRSAAAETKALHGSEPPHRRRRLRRSVQWALVVVALGAAALATVRTLRGRPGTKRAVPEAKVLAVLPFRDLTGRADGQLVADGFAETLSAQLARAPGVQVLTPLATAAFREDADAARLVGQLGATLVLRGSVQRAGELVRVSWLVLSGSGGPPLGGDTQTGPAADLFALQDRVATGVVAVLGFAHGASTPPPGPRGAAEQERYLAALGHLQRYQDPAAVDAAIGILEPLARDQGDSAPVLAALGRAYLAKRFLTRDPSWSERAREACLRAERVDGTLSEVHLTLGRIAAESGDPEAAVAALRKVLDRRPDDVDALLALADAFLLAGKNGEAEDAARRALAASPAYWAVHNKLGVVYVSSGRTEEAIEEFRGAVALAPENARGLVNLGSALVVAGRLPEAAEALRKSLSVEPTAEGLSALGTVEFYRGLFDEAAAEYEKAVALSPRFSTLWANLGDARRWSSSARDRAPEAYARAIEAANEELRANPKDVDAHLALAVSFAKTGRPAEAAPHVAAALGADPENPDTLHQAAVCEAASGRTREAAELLHRAEKRGAPAWQIEADPELRAIRASPEYREKPAGKGGAKTEGS